MESNSISIVIPCYNSSKRIVGCIRAVKDSLNSLINKNKFEIIVVNDGSTDDTASIISKETGITIITHSKNKGLSSARNSGIEASNSEYIVFIDSDIIIEKDWIQKTLDLLMSDSSIMGVIGHLAHPLTKKKTSLLDIYLFSNYRGAKKIDNKTPLLYKWFVFSNTIIKRHLLKKTGCFDENICAYGGEDTELSIRINKKLPHGLRKAEGAIAYHYCDKSLNVYMKNMYDYGLNNFNYIIKKHPDYKQNLNGNVPKSFIGYLIFNPFNASLCSLLLKFIKHPLLIKFLVINSFVRGVRNSKK